MGERLAQEVMCWRNGQALRLRDESCHLWRRQLLCEGNCGLCPFLWTCLPSAVGGVLKSEKRWSMEQGHAMQARLGKLELGSWCEWGLHRRTLMQISDLDYPSSHRLRAAPIYGLSLWSRGESPKGNLWKTVSSEPSLALILFWDLDLGCAKASEGFSYWFQSG